VISLTRINGNGFVLNSDLIEHIEMTPHSVVTLTNGQKFVVREPADEVVRRVIRFRRAVQSQGMPITVPRSE